jgi:hypothetical protein
MRHEEVHRKQIIYWAKTKISTKENTEAPLDTGEEVNLENYVQGEHKAALRLSRQDEI